MLAIPVLWLLLGVPGVLIARRLLPRLAGGGVMALLPVGYLAVFALLSPVSIVGHLLNAPLWVLSASWLLLSAAGLFELGRLAYGARASLGLRLRAALREPTRWVEPGAALVLFADLGLAFLRGSHTGGDSGYHIGRVRMVLDHGLNSWDAVFAGQHFEAQYHTNLYHALIASSAQLSGLQAFEAWLGMLPWAKLIVASCSYSLAYSVFEKRAHAWLGALFTAVFFGPYTVLVYPNTLAGYFVLAQGVTLLVQLLARDAGRAGVLALGALSLVAAQLHMLYGVFLVLLLAPVLGSALLRGLRGPDRSAPRLLLGACLALGLCLPFVWFARHPPAPSASAAEQAAMPYPELPPVTPAALKAANVPSAKLPQTPGGFRRTEAGQLMLNPAPWADPSTPGPYLLVLLVLGALGLGRPTQADTRAFRITLGVLGTWFAWLLIPPVCELLVRVSGAPWIVSRLVVLSQVYMNALFAPLLFGLLGTLAGRAPLQLLACAATVAYANQVGVDSSVWPRSDYLKLYAEGPVERDKVATSLGKYAAVLARNVPPGSTVWADPGQANRIGALCDCHAFVIYPGGGNRGMADMGRRRIDVERVLDPALPLESRVALLRYYGLTRLFTNNRGAAKRIESALGPVIVRRDHEGPARVFTIDYARLDRARHKRH